NQNRAAETNRATDRANTQTLRSAGYAHQGAAGNSERGANVQQNRANAAARADERVGTQARGPQQQNREQVAANHDNKPQGQQHLNSATYAHGQNARGATAETPRQPSVAANARDNTQRDRAAANARDNAQRERVTANAARDNAARASAEQSRNRAIAEQNARHEPAQANPPAQPHPQSQPHPP